MFALLCPINKPTYYQSKNPTCTNLFLTNKRNLPKSSDKFETDHFSL